MTTVINIKDCEDFDPRNNPNDVYIGRFHTSQYGFFPKSKWHNPFAEADYDRNTAVQAYRKYIHERPELLSALPELEGKCLGCWCKPLPCHGDVLIELLNKLKKLT
jgi:hypothetical protein